VISSALADSPAWISRIELETIWMSRMAMNMPTTMAMKPAHCRPVTAGCAGVTGDVDSADEVAVDSGVSSFTVGR
jgi:hypothetical protein